MNCVRIRTRLFVAGAALLIIAGAARADDAGYDDLIAKRGGSLVTVKFMLKISMGGLMAQAGDEEWEQEVSGVMIEPTGLVLLSNTQLSGFTAMMKRFMGPMGAQISATPNDIKVLIGDDVEGLPAELLARDTEHDLAWVKIKDPPKDRRFDAVDLRSAIRPKRGDRLLALQRMGKYFDRVMIVSETRVGGAAKKPRELIVPSWPIGSLGTVVFDVAGRPVGATVLQMPEGDDESGNPIAMMAQAAEMESVMRGLILPAEEILKATERAKTTAAQRAASAPAAGERGDKKADEAGAEEK